MTVGEYIEALKRFPAEMKVVAPQHSDYTDDVSEPTIARVIRRRHYVESVSSAKRRNDERARSVRSWKP